jgi:hypothetical protein
MNYLQIKHLLKLCKKHKVDPYEIDSTLSYAENKKHMRSLIINPERDMDKWDSAEEQYLKDHPLWNYIMNTLKTRHRKVPPEPEGFSLRAYAQSLKTQANRSPFSPNECLNTQ